MFLKVTIVDALLGLTMNGCGHIFIYLGRNVGLRGDEESMHVVNFIKKSE